MVSRLTSVSLRYSLRKAIVTRIRRRSSLSETGCRKTTIFLTLPTWSRVSTGLKELKSPWTAMLMLSTGSLNSSKSKLRATTESRRLWYKETDSSQTDWRRTCSPKLITNSVVKWMTSTIRIASISWWRHISCSLTGYTPRSGTTTFRATSVRSSIHAKSVSPTSIRSLSKISPIAYLISSLKGSRNARTSSWATFINQGLIKRSLCKKLPSRWKERMVNLQNQRQK